jgi:hypothetical protein
MFNPALDDMGQLIYLCCQTRHPRLSKIFIFEDRAAVPSHFMLPFRLDSTLCFDGGRWL